MGSGVAQKIAQEGIPVIMVDTEERFVQKGLENIRTTLDAAIERRIFSPEQADRVMEMVTGTTDLEMVKDADIVIEAIYENEQVKKDLFGRLDTICEEKTILASNTSSFSIDTLADSVKRKDRFVGLHFFYHPAKNRLLEIIPGSETSDETIDISHRFSNMIGKNAIDVKDAPGFAVNRFFVPWLNEAARIYGEGIADIPTIDAVAKEAFSIGMGPFELMNATGIPIAYHSTITLGNELGAFYEPSPRLREQFEKAVNWDLDGIANVDIELWESVQSRLLGTVFTVACDLVEEGVASIEDTDRGAKIGLRWKYGPFELMNGLGMTKTYEIVSEFTERYPDLEIPNLLHNQYGCKEPWQISFVDLRIEGSIAYITFNRPEAMNAINETVMQQLNDHFSFADVDPDVETIVLEGAGKAFIAGADIEYFIKKIDDGLIQDIVDFTKFGHAVLEKIDNSEKLVIAKLDGLSLGGGTEIALAADIIVASEKGSIGFPETGIGIYPGLGGTQRTTRFIGKELAKYLIFTGKVLGAEKAAVVGLVDHVVPAQEIEESIVKLAASKKAPSKAILDTPERITGSEDFARIKEYFTDENLGKLLAGDQGFEFDAFGAKLAKTISYKAPIAITFANKLIDEGGTLSLDQGLQMELDNLVEIFETEDAYEGLSSVVQRRRPTFTGK